MFPQFFFFKIFQKFVQNRPQFFENYSEVFLEFLPNIFQHHFRVFLAISSKTLQSFPQFFTKNRRQNVAQIRYQVFLQFLHNSEYQIRFLGEKSPQNRENFDFREFWM